MGKKISHLGQDLSESRKASLRDGFLFTFSTVYIVALVIANIASNKITHFFGYTIDAGYLFFPITYIINDIVTEVYGLKRAKQLIWSGLIGNLFAVVAIHIVVLMPADPSFLFQKAFTDVFQSSNRIFAGSVISYLFGEMLNARVLVFLKRRNDSKRSMPIRFMLSTICGSFIENSLFYIIAFAGTLDWSVIYQMMILQYLIKIGLEVIVLPITCGLAVAIKKHLF